MVKSTLAKKTSIFNIVTFLLWNINGENTAIVQGLPMTVFYW